MEAKITKEMSIAEVLRINRMTAPIFMQYGMHCLSCHATAESLEEARAVHGIDVDELVADQQVYCGKRLMGVTCSFFSGEKKEPKKSRLGLSPAWLLRFLRFLGAIYGKLPGFSCAAWLAQSQRRFLFSVGVGSRLL